MNNNQQKQNNLTFWQLWNMSFGLFGIQYGWTLQLANASAIYEYLGAKVEQLPLLWIAAPISGLIVQPLVGYFSDRTWCRLGRRRPYFLFGAVLSFLALILIPNASNLWLAVGLMLILNISINISLQPFRALITDLVPIKQQNQGFILQSFFLGLGAVIACLSPWCFHNLLNLHKADFQTSSIPITVKLSFYLGAVILLATVIWTVISTKEYSDENNLVTEKSSIESSQNSKLQNYLIAYQKLFPDIMKQLGSVQFFTWLGIFAVIIYFPSTVAYYIFDATEKHLYLYSKGIEWASLCIGFYNLVCLIFSLFLTRIIELTSRKSILAFSLVCGGLGIISIYWIDNKYMLFLPMICLGIVWSTIHSIPYAILAKSVPAKNMGTYMGIFNIFIVLPQIVNSLGLGWLMFNLLDNNSALVLVLGGVSLLIAAICVYGVEDLVEEPDLAVTLSTINLRQEN
jgi:maltose/moltooligosaccharide transporter